MSTWDTPLEREHNEMVEKAGWTGFFIGLLLGAISMMLIVQATQGNYRSCLEDEVWTYQGDWPDAVTWSCVPLDDLIYPTVTTPPHSVREVK